MCKRFSAVFAFIFVLTLHSSGQQFMVGTANADITYKLPAALQGQFHLRIADKIESPLTANALVLESPGKDTVVFVSCDLTFITSDLSVAVRKEVKQLLPGFNTQKIIVTATHTHTVPVYASVETPYPIPENITQPKEYFKYLASRIASLIQEAWTKRKPVNISYGLGHAVVAQNRRALYNNGKASMYGNTNTPTFKNIEGMEDHDLNALFISNLQGKLVAVCAAVPCPAQEVEGNEAVNADFWHEIRTALRKRWGKDLAVIGWSAAAGDQSPHLLYRSAAENRMNKLSGRTRLQEIAYRVDDALAKTWELAKKEKFNNPAIQHLVDSVELPARVVTEDEMREATKNADYLRDLLAKQPELIPKRQAEMKWHQEVVDRYNKQQGQAKPVIHTEIHAVKLGDIVIATNEFELFTDYGIRMQARSKALQTFVVQLAVGYYIYLPTEIAVKGGSYSAIVQSCIVNPEGGDILVDRSVELINKMF